MALFEALYGRCYRNLLNWIKLSEKVILGHDNITEAEMQMRDVGHLSLKLEIMSTFVYHL
jgi:hypothetical protein